MSAGASASPTSEYGRWTPSAKASDDRIAPPPRGEGGSGGVLSSASDDDGGGFQSAIRAERAWRARQSNPDISSRQADATEDPPRAWQSDGHLDAPPTRSRPVVQGHRHQLLQLDKVEAEQVAQDGLAPCPGGRRPCRCGPGSSQPTSVTSDRMQARDLIFRGAFSVRVIHHQRNLLGLDA